MAENTFKARARSMCLSSELTMNSRRSLVPRHQLTPTDTRADTEVAWSGMRALARVSAESSPTSATTRFSGGVMAPPWMSEVSLQRPVSGVWCWVSDVGCLVLGVLCLVSSVGCLVLGVWCQVSTIWCPQSGVWCPVSGVWCGCTVSDVWCPVCDVWSLVCGVW